MRRLRTYLFGISVVLLTLYFVETEGKYQTCSVESHVNRVVALSLLPKIRQVSCFIYSSHDLIAKVKLG